MEKKSWSSIENLSEMQKMAIEALDMTNNFLNN